METDMRNPFSKWEWLTRSSDMMRIWLIMWEGSKPQTIGLDSELDLSKYSGSKSQPLQGQDWTNEIFQSFDPEIWVWLLFTENDIY